MDRFPVISQSVYFFSFYHCSAELFCIEMPYCAIIYGKLRCPKTEQNGVCLAAYKQVVCWKQVGQLWSETPDRPLVQFLECLDAPWVDSFQKEPTWQLHATSQAAQEALSPHQGFLRTSLMLLSCTNHKPYKHLGSRTRLSLIWCHPPRNAKYQQIAALHELFWPINPLLWNWIPAGLDGTTFLWTSRLLVQNLHWNSDLIPYDPGNVINSSKKITFNLQSQCGNIYPDKLLSFIFLVGCNSSKI